jgi:hypothetical protein
MIGQAFAAAGAIDIATRWSGGRDGGIDLCIGNPARAPVPRRAMVGRAPHGVEQLMEQ